MIFQCFYLSNFIFCLILSFYHHFFSVNMSHHYRLIKLCDFIKILYFFKSYTIQNYLSMISFHNTNKFVIFTFIKRYFVWNIFWSIKVQYILLTRSLIPHLYFKLSTKFMIDINDLSQNYNFINLKNVLYFSCIGVDFFNHFESNWNDISDHGRFLRKHIHCVFIWLSVIHEFKLIKIIKGKL